MRTLTLPLVASTTFLTGALVACVAHQIVVPPAHAQSHATRWEYVCEDLSGKPTQELNRFGTQGWELVTVATAVISGSSLGDPRYCFKRPLP
jgi:hypothetical protein